jgi:hypothetical protein
VFKCKRNCGRLFKIRRVSIDPQQQKRGGVVNGKNYKNNNNPYAEKQGFSTQDILWALGIWSVILSLSPVVLFYVLMVN